MRWIEKWLAPFNDLDELYHLAKFGEDRTTRAGCRCENMAFFTFFTGRMPVFKFTHSLVVQNFTPIGALDGNAAPKMAKISTFL